MLIRWAFFVAVLLGLAAMCLPGASLDGDWTGSLQAGPQTLRLALHVVKDAEGGLSATLDSLDQGAMGLKIDTITLDGNQLRFRMSQPVASYEGVVSDDGSSIDGTWSQGQFSAPLVFQKSDGSAEPAVGVFEDAALGELAGTWQGRLNAGQVSLRIVFRVEEQDGGFRVTMESPDQGPSRIPITEIDVSDTSVTYEVASVGGRFAGKLNPEGTELSGTWSQGGNELPLVLRRVEEAAELEGPDGVFDDAALAEIAGIWMGELDAGQITLRVVLRIEDYEGKHKVTLQSPDQSPTMIPVTAITVGGQSVKFEVKGIGGRYEGTLDEDGSAMSGTWTQGGNDLPLRLKKTDRVPAARRPQNPKPPYPYREVQVEFAGGEAGVRLAGTLTLPKDGGPFPGVVLISGSGPQDRDETVMGHKPFLVLADYLTRQGIAVLRYDDRGTARSSGSFSAATSEDFADDAYAAVRYLRGRDEVARDQSSDTVSNVANSGWGVDANGVVTVTPLQVNPS